MLILIWKAKIKAYNTTVFYFLRVKKNWKIELEIRYTCTQFSHEYGRTNPGVFAMIRLNHNTACMKYFSSCLLCLRNEFQSVHNYYHVKAFKIKERSCDDSHPRICNIICLDKFSLQEPNE